MSDDKEVTRHEPFEAIFIGDGPDNYVTRYDRNKPDSTRRAREHKRGQKERIKQVLKRIHID